MRGQYSASKIPPSSSGRGEYSVSKVPRNTNYGGITLDRGYDRGYETGFDRGYDRLKYAGIYDNKYDFGLTMSPHLSSGYRRRYIFWNYFE